MTAPVVLLSPIFSSGTQFTNIGIPLNGGFIYTYYTGTNTPAPTYTDNTGLTANANPIVLSPYGRLPSDVWLVENIEYKFVLTDANNNTLETHPLVYGIPLNADIPLSIDANDIRFTSSITGGVLRTGQAKFSDFISVKDFGAVGNGSTDDTSAFITAMTSLFALGGNTLYIPAGNYIISSWVFQWTNGSGFNIVGAGKRATTLTKKPGTTTPVIDFSNVSVGDGIYSTFSDFSIVGNAKSNHGFRATLLARIEMHNVEISGCDTAFENVGSLIALHTNCDYTGNNVGVRTRKSGSVYCNVISVIGGGVRGNTSFGFDIGDTGSFHIDKCDIEANGTSLNTSTGAVIIRSTCGAETGYGIISVKDGWFESNVGSTFYLENPAYSLSLSMRDTNFFSSEAGLALTCNGTLRSILLDNVNAPGSGDTIVVNAGYSVVRGGSIYTLTDNSTNYTHQGILTNAGAIVLQIGDQVTGQTQISGKKINSGFGSTSCLNNTATTIFTALGSTPGLYTVYTYLVGGGTPYQAIGYFGSDGSTIGNVTGTNSANLSISLSGSNIQVTQTSGVTQIIHWIVGLVAV